MNDKIKELAEQTGENLSNVIRNDEWLEKFAELIVQECGKICDGVQERYGQYTFTARVCKEEIKEHFGVKE